MDKKSKKRGDFTTLEPELSSVKKARQFIHVFLEHENPDEVYTVELLTSEVVSNAVIHSGGKIKVILSLIPSKSIRVDVLDHSTKVPTVSDFAVDAYTGRGLTIVSSLSDKWGVEKVDEGKSVWFEKALGGEKLRSDGNSKVADILGGIPEKPEWARVTQYLEGIRRELISSYLNTNYATSQAVLFSVITEIEEKYADELAVLYSRIGTDNAISKDDFYCVVPHAEDRKNLCKLLGELLDGCESEVGLLAQVPIVIIGKLSAIRSACIEK